MQRFLKRAPHLMLGLLAGIQLSSCGLMDEETTTVETTTVTAADTAAPTILFTVPTNAGSDTSVTGDLKVVFSEEMDNDTLDNLTLALTDSSGSAVATTVTYSDQIATINPAANLSYGATYILEFDADAITDVAGNSLSGTSLIVFNTEVSPDTTAPTVTSTTPANSATAVAVSDPLTINFSEDMQLDNLTTSTITLVDGNSASVSGTVTFGSGQQAIFTPDADLELNTTYTATVSSGVEDTSGNGLSSNEVWSFTTVAYSNMSSVASVATGEQFSCALFTDRTAKCWGVNSTGQLGDGTLSNNTLPVAVNGLTEATEISSGVKHSCARVNDRTAKCWGDNQLGQLGDGSGVSNTVPVSVAGLVDLRQVTSGAFHSCAIQDNYTAVCWGSNNSGQLGDGTTTAQTTAVAVTGGITNFEQLSAGGQSISAHTCGLVDNGTVYCWGENNQGQLGDNTTTDNGTPDLVIGLTDVNAISTGGRHSCAIQDNGTGFCWGDNLYGQLGDNSTDDRYMATNIAGSNNFTAISAGFYHTCAIDNSSQVYCWGDNRYGQLGDNSTTTRYVPTAVSGVDNATEISAGDYHTCAVLADETVQCWGYNSYGQLGNNETNTLPASTERGELLPVNVVDP